MGGCGGKSNNPKPNDREDSGEYLDEPYQSNREEVENSQQFSKEPPRNLRKNPNRSLEIQGQNEGSNYDEYASKQVTPQNKGLGYRKYRAAKPMNQTQPSPQNSEYSPKKESNPIMQNPMSKNKRRNSPEHADDDNNSLFDDKRSNVGTRGPAQQKPDNNGNNMQQNPRGSMQSQQPSQDPRVYSTRKSPNNSNGQRSYQNSLRNSGIPRSEGDMQYSIQIANRQQKSMPTGSEVNRSNLHNLRQSRKPLSRTQNNPRRYYASKEDSSGGRTGRNQRGSPNDSADGSRQASRNSQMGQTIRSNLSRASRANLLRLTNGSLADVIESDDGESIPGTVNTLDSSSNKKRWEKSKLGPTIVPYYALIPNFCANPALKIDLLVNEKPGLNYNAQNPYLNALLQCLWGTQPLVDYFLYNIHLNEETMFKYMTEEERLLTELFADATKLYWLEPTNPLDIEELSVFVSEVLPLPENVTPDCVVDLLDLFLDELHATLNRQFKFRTIYDDRNLVRKRRAKKKDENAKKEESQQNDDDDLNGGYYRVRGSRENPLGSLVMDGIHDPELEFVNPLDGGADGKKLGLNRMPSIRANAPGLINARRISFQRPVSQMSAYTYQTKVSSVREEENEDDNDADDVKDDKTRSLRTGDDSRTYYSDENHQTNQPFANGRNKGPNDLRSKRNKYERESRIISEVDEENNSQIPSDQEDDDISERNHRDEKRHISRGGRNEAKANTKRGTKDGKHENASVAGSYVPSQSYYSDGESLNGRSVDLRGSTQNKAHQQATQRRVQKPQNQNLRSENDEYNSQLDSRRESIMEETKDGKNPNPRQQKKVPSRQPTDARSDYSFAGESGQGDNNSKQGKNPAQQKQKLNDSLDRNSLGKKNNSREDQSRPQNKIGGQNGKDDYAESNDFDDNGDDNGDDDEAESNGMANVKHPANQRVTKGGVQAPERQNNPRRPAGAGRGTKIPGKKKVGESQDDFFEDNGLFTGQNDEEEEEEKLPGPNGQQEQQPLSVVEEEQSGSVVGELQNRQVKMGSGPQYYQRGVQEMSDLKKQHSAYLETMQDDNDYVTKYIHVKRSPGALYFPFELRADTDYHRKAVKESIENSKIYWREYLRANSSIIVDLLVGILMTTNLCIECGTGKSRFEAFMYTSVNIPEKEDGSAISIYECIADFATQELDDQTKNWFCPECNAHRDVLCQTSFWVLPNILIMQIERTEPNGTWNDSMVEIPLDDLNLEEFANTQQRDIPLYRLYAVLEVIFDGDQIFHAAKVRNRMDGQWYIFEEENTILIENPEQEVITKNAYLLFFQNKSAPYFSRQQVNRSELWPFLDHKMNMNIFNKGIYKDLVDPSYIQYLRERNKRALNLDGTDERIETIVEIEEEQNSDDEHDEDWKERFKKRHDNGYWPDDPDEMLRKSFDPRYKDLQLPNMKGLGRHNGDLDPDMHSWIHGSDAKPIKKETEKPVSRQLPDRTPKSRQSDNAKTPKSNNSVPNPLHDMILNSDKTSHFVNKILQQANPDPTPKPTVQLKAEPISIKNPEKLDEIKELLHIGQYVTDYHKRNGPVPDIHPEYQPRIDPIINKPRTDLEYRRINENNFLYKEPGEVVTRDMKKRPEDDSTNVDAKKNRLKGLH